jgi:hypothetical protein
MALEEKPIELSKSYIQYLKCYLRQIVKFTDCFLSFYLYFMLQKWVAIDLISKFDWRKNCVSNQFQISYIFNTFFWESALENWTQEKKNKCKNYIGNGRLNETHVFVSWIWLLTQQKLIRNLHISIMQAYHQLFLCNFKLLQHTSKLS